MKPDVYVVRLRPKIGVASFYLCGENAATDNLRLARRFHRRDVAKSLVRGRIESGWEWLEGAVVVRLVVRAR